MCGIAGIISKVNANIIPKLIKMLVNLEYRGYDSCGFAYISDGNLIITKRTGFIKTFVKETRLDEERSHIGIAHTRWATHGDVSDANAHPHVDCNSKIAVVHNGIIDNYLELKEMLEDKGHVFRSDTDTEVIPHLLEEFLKKQANILHALEETVKMLKGTYAIAILTTYDRNKIFFARNGQPLVIGIGDEDLFLASDIPAFLEWTQKVVVLRDGDIGYICREKYYITNVLDYETEIPSPQIVPWNPLQAQRGEFPHFMLKEIFEQPDAIRRTILTVPKQLESIAPLLSNSKRIYFVGAGSSYYSSLYGRYLFAKYGINAEAAIASEFADLYSKTIDRDDIVIAVSQSGETFDTIQAIKVARSSGCRVIGLINNMASTIKRLSDYTIVMGAGPEIGVAATKTFTTQTVSMVLILNAYLQSIGEDTEHNTILNDLPSIIKGLLPRYNEHAKSLSKFLLDKQSMFYLGRGIGFPIALEGALKMKEIAYIHAEAYPAGESKHGPIALIEKNFPVIEIVLHDKNYDKMLSSIEEMRARGALIISLIPENEDKTTSISHATIKFPSINQDILPILYVIPLQLLAYHAAVARGFNPDRPRNLAKSVTVA